MKSVKKTLKMKKKNDYSFYEWPSTAMVQMNIHNTDISPDAFKKD